MTSPDLQQLVPTHTLPTHAEQHKQNIKVQLYPGCEEEASLNLLHQQKETKPQTSPKISPNPASFSNTQEDRKGHLG